MEGIGKVYVIKGFYRNFLTLKGNYKFWSTHIRTIRKEVKNKEYKNIF